MQIPLSATIVINLCVESGHFRTHTAASLCATQIKSNTKLRFMFTLVRVGVCRAQCELAPGTLGRDGINKT